MAAALFYSSSQVSRLKSQDDYLDMVLILVIANHILQFFTQEFLNADKKPQMATGVQSHMGQVIISSDSLSSK